MTRSQMAQDLIERWENWLRMDPSEAEARLARKTIDLLKRLLGPVRPEGDARKVEVDRPSRRIALHGVIELEVPGGMSAYGAWQQLESLLDPEFSGVLDSGVWVADFQLGCYFDPAEGPGGGKTSAFKSWIKDVLQGEDI